jgi:hypothetical protein
MMRLAHRESSGADRCREIGWKQGGDGRGGGDGVDGAVAEFGKGKGRAEGTDKADLLEP